MTPRHNLAAVLGATLRGHGLFPALCLALAAGCAAGERTEADDVFIQPASVVAAASDPVIARVDGQPIHESEAVARARRRELPPSPEKAAEITDDLVLEDLLAAHARGQSLHTAPKVRHAVRRAIVQRLIEEDFETKVTPQGIPEDTLRSLYQENFWYYNNPEMRSFEHLLVRCTRTQSAALHGAARALAEALLLAAKEQRPERLEALLPAAQPRALKWGLTVDVDNARSARTQLERDFADLLYTLPLGQVGDRVVQSRFGYHVVRTTKIEPPFALAYEQALPDIRERAWPTYRQGRFRQWVASLREKYDARPAPAADLLFREPAAARK